MASVALKQTPPIDHIITLKQMRRQKKIKIGIIGCGAIGSRIAKSIKRELKNYCILSGVYDIDIKKAKNLEKEVSSKGIVRESLKNLLKNCDFVVEAVASEKTKDIIRSILKAKKSLLVMSIGKLLNASDLFQLAIKNRCALLLPSGAIGGLDAIKAANLTNISSIKLTTRKPPSGFKHSTYLKKRNIDINSLHSETVLFDGPVAKAVQLFPENINVAATIALASNLRKKLRIKILTSPYFKRNSHQIEMKGDFGRLTCCTENVVCPDNPKTSYLAVLSAIQTLKQFFSFIKIGT